MRYIGVLAFFSFVLVSDAAVGQLSPSRFIIVAPNLRPSDDTTGARYLTQHGLWANLQKGFKSAGDRFGWSIAFGGILEFVSWPGASFGMQGSIEVLADTRNDISFNPQGVNWEEGLLYNFAVGNLELAAGYLHRCVHNIDNLLTTNPDARDMQRTLIYGSLSTRALLRDTTTDRNDRLKLHAWLGADYYLVREDYRYPEQALRLSPDLEKLRFSLTAGNYSEFLIGSSSLFTRLSIMASFFTDTLTANLRGELGINIPGEAMDMQVFFGLEAFTDDGGSVIPRKSDFFYAGLRFFGKNIAL